MGLGENDPFVVRMCAAALASVTTELSTLPIDTIKVRLQVQALGQGNAQQRPYHGMIHALFKIPREEGLVALWKGLGPALARQVTYSTLTLILYQPIRNMFTKDGEISFSGKLLSGGISGATGLFFVHPIEVMKIRMQADSGTRYQGMSKTFTHLYRKEGIRSFSQGLLPNLQRGFIVNAVEFGVYDQAKCSILSTGKIRDGFGLHFIASTLSGIASAVASTPVDVVKTRLMNQGIGATVQYKGMIDCFYQTASQEGPMALYKGFIPTITRKIPFCVIFFVSYEKFSNLVSYFYK